MPSQQFWSDAWYQGRWWLLFLLPFSYLFRGLAQWRRRKQQALARPAAVPVVVVGNISLGGTGKTPLLIALVEELRKRGLNPGVVSRGYGGRAPQYPFVVRPDSDVKFSGDEPLLIAMESNCPVVVSPNRNEAVNELLKQFDCDVILSDDGLQHYQLHRDIEICVVDGQRGLGNGQCLPAGPLREPALRLQDVDWVIVNGDLSKPLAAQASANEYVTMRVEPVRWLELSSNQSVAIVDQVFDKPLKAMSGIGNPQRFFDTLSVMGLQAENHIFSDHYAYSPDDLAFADDSTLLMTSKDAVKCRDFVKPDWWSLTVAANLPADFYDRLAEQIKLAARS
jgi:tetraacyldisaccharide 4'-kinase